LDEKENSELRDTIDDTNKRTDTQKQIAQNSSIGSATGKRTDTMT